MNKPLVISVTHDDDSHSHWALINPENGEKLWSENPEECAAQGYKVKSSPAPALTEEIERTIWKCIEEISGFEKEDTCQGDIGYIGNKAKELSHLLSNSREGKDGEGWISCKEKTPEKEGEYATYSERFDWVTTFDWVDGKWHSDVYPKKEVQQELITHWQPLPPAPKTQKGDSK